MNSMPTDASTAPDADLVAFAREARSRAYAPYSGFAVGAVLRTEDGTVYFGCNVENATFGLTLCAERVALFAALTDGHTRFDVMAVHVPDGQRSTPCGICRQMLAEFAPEARILLANADGSFRERRVPDLIPGTRTSP
jgi:cytidine deaminase